LTFEKRSEQSWCRTQQSAPQLINGRLKNPAGRTGLIGRGSLGLWGPNKAGDPVIIARGDTLNQHIRRGRRLTSDYGGVAFNSKTYYVRLIMRTDVAAVAIPGGMVDPGESGLQAAIREFQEEAMAGTGGAEVGQVLNSMNPRLVYRGLVDDPRNTDDAWMETEAFLIDISGQDPPGSLKQKVRAKAITGRAGDDAGSVRWLSLTDAARGTLTWIKGRKPMRLACCYASHYAIIQLAVAKLQNKF
jgi:ADP-ribose pyrophosphatase